MTPNGWLQIILYMVVLIGLAKPLGSFMADVYQGERTFLDPLLRPLERVIYRLCGVRADEEMDWKTYTVAFLIFSLFSLCAVYFIQRLQWLLPLNPAAMGAPTADLSWNTAVSFATNTNWQSYGGETTLSYLTQMTALTVQNFASAAAGMAVLAAFIRAFARHSSSKLGNFWADLVRGMFYILLPLSIVLALLLVSQGVVQTMNPYQAATVVQPTTYQTPKLDASGSAVKDAAGNPVMLTVTQTQQTIAVGPAASQIAIKQLGTNGGGFFNVNSAHPFENPTPITGFLESISILLIAGALCYTFGKMVGDTRQGWALLAAMSIILLVMIAWAYAAEAAGNPRLAAVGADQTASDAAPGGNMEGKEVRFGVPNSALWATTTTAASNGSVDSMHDSYTPLGGMVPLIMMHLGETVFGGVGSGLYGMLIFVIVAVFVAGLMVGRTPEYLGKKIEAYEIKMSSILILLMPVIVLFFTALAVATDAGKAIVFNPGPHGFSELLYFYTSTGNNNGSAFAGAGTNTLFGNVSGGIAMLLARFWWAVPTMALAGALARKKKVPPSAGTLPTHTPLFVGWLIGVVILVGALNFIPALALGPIVEHFIMLGG